MAITNYTELKSAVADWLNRDDLTTVIPSFIALAEAKLNRDVRHFKMEKRAESTLDSRFHQLPSDWLEIVRINLNGTTARVLNYITPETMTKKREENGNATGTPHYYTFVSGELEFFPTPDGDYSMDMVYRAKLDGLSDTQATNWLITESPDVYLYGALVQSAPYLKDDERLQVWAALSTESVQALNRASKQAVSGSLSMKINSY